MAHSLGPSVTVGSAGTQAAAGQAADPRMQPFFPDLSMEGFVARQVGEELIEEADLILTMTRAHRAYVLALVPSAVRRTFALLDFAKWLSVAEPDELPGATPAERLLAAIASVPDLRARAPRRRSASCDIPDPFGSNPATYRVVAKKIHEATDQIAAALAPPRRVADGGQRPE